jgi:hypothetical protein
MTSTTLFQTVLWHMLRTASDSLEFSSEFLEYHQGSTHTGVYSLALAYQVTSAVWRFAGRLPSRLLQNTGPNYHSLATSARHPTQAASDNHKHKGHPRATSELKHKRPGLLVAADPVTSTYREPCVQIEALAPHAAEQRLVARQEVVKNAKLQNLTAYCPCSMALLQGLQLSTL